MIRRTGTGTRGPSRQVEAAPEPNCHHPLKSGCVAAMNGEAKMFLMGLGALLVLGGVLYMARATIWRGWLSRPARDTLEPPPRGVGFLGFRTN